MDGGRGLQAGNLGVLGANGLQQPGAKFGPAIFQPGSGIFQAARIGGGAGQPGGFCDPKHHVIKGIEIAEDGECRGKRGRTTGGGCSVCLCQEPRQRGVEVSLHGVDVLLGGGADIVRRLPAGNVEVGDGSLDIGQGRAQVGHGKAGGRGRDCWGGLRCGWGRRREVGLLAHGRRRSRRETTGSKALL